MNFKHGGRKSRLYAIWSGIKSRCFNKKRKSYKRYGGVGITICEQWGNYLSFRDWSMNNGYSDNLVIDRINTFGNYEPSNCRWVTQKVNMNNQKTNFVLTIWGETKTLKQWSEDKRCLVKYGTLHRRIRRYGYSYEKALTAPKKH